MSFTEIDVDLTGEFTGQGRMPFSLAEIKSNIAGVDLLKQLVAKFVEVQKAYGRALHEDNRLLGSERFIVADRLAEALDLVIMMRAKFEHDETFVLSDEQMDRHLQFQLESDRWRATGKLGMRRKFKTHHFSDWLHRMAHERLPGIIRYFAEIARDGVFTPTEVAGLDKLLDRLFFSIVIVREAVVSGEME